MTQQGMPYRCGNCGGAFTAAEASRCKPPIHPWPMTASGQRTIAEAPARGLVLGVCPECGQQTMHVR